MSASQLCVAISSGVKYTTFFDISVQVVVKLNFSASGVLRGLPNEFITQTKMSLHDQLLADLEEVDEEDLAVCALHQFIWNILSFYFSDENIASVVPFCFVLRLEFSSIRIIISHTRQGDEADEQEEEVEVIFKTNSHANAKILIRLPSLKR